MVAIWTWRWSGALNFHLKHGAARIGAVLQVNRSFFGVSPRWSPASQLTASVRIVSGVHGGAVRPRDLGVSRQEWSQCSKSCDGGQAPGPQNGHFSCHVMPFLMISHWF